MANFKFEPQTNPNTGEVYYEAQFQSKLVSVNAENVLTNSNKTEYILGTIEYEDAAGKVATASAQIYMSNYKADGKVRMTPGNTYLTAVRVTPGDTRPPLVIVSHLTTAPRATADSFGFSLADAKAEAPKADIFAETEA